MFCRSVSYVKIRDEAEKLIEKASFNIASDVLEAIGSERKDSTGLACRILKDIEENARIAAEEKIPPCQDTGIGVFFVKIGTKVIVEGGTVRDALNEGVRRAYERCYLRKSVVSHPLKRINTKDNTPAVIHFEESEGEEIRIDFLAKGAGSENMSRIKMFSPSADEKSIIDFIVETVKEAGPNPCPPSVLGIGIGGTFEYAAVMAKRALLRKIGERNADTDMAALENQVTEAVNKYSGVGIQGLGTGVTVLDTFIETSPCHIASLPVAVNFNCHSVRHAGVVI